MEDDAVPSFRQKMKQSFCFSCCFPRSESLPLQYASDTNPALIWIETAGAAPNYSLSDIRDKCCAILGISGAKSKRPSSGMCRYDPLSYALNFEDAIEFDDDVPLNSFSARLPPSPRQPTAEP